MHAKKSHASLCTRALYITYLMVTKAKQAFTPKMTHGVCTLGTKEYEDPTLGIWEFCLNQIPGSYWVSHFIFLYFERQIFHLRNNFLLFEIHFHILQT